MMLIRMPFKRCIAAEIGAAIATGIGAVASSGINAYSQHRTNAVNRQQADYAFRQQQLAIQRQNEYNSPAQQVLRMKAAGLNPALAYGANGEMVGNQADVPAYNAIPAEAPNVGRVGSDIAEAVRTGIEVKDFERRQNLATAEMALKDWQSYLAFTQGSLNEAQAQEITYLMGYKADNLESQTQLNWENVLKTRQEISNLKSQKQEILSRIKLNEAQVSELAAREGLSEAQAYAILSRLPYEIQSLDASAALDWAMTAEGQAKVKQINREVQHIGYIERLENAKFNFDKESWRIEQEKWSAELDQNRRLHFIDGITHIIGLGVGASALRSGQTLPSTTGRRAPITSSHHGTGSLGASPKPKTNSQGYRIGSR